ncbi:MAG: DNA-3-methyladenine glycosylase [Thermoleophilia bacterium]
MIPRVAEPTPGRRAAAGGVPSGGRDLGWPSMRVLPPSFFARPADLVAPELIGKILWREGVGGGRLVEVEAYLPEDDPACHAHRGMTPRNRAMFGPPGTVYVYVSYGVHLLLNLVCEVEGVAAAVLVRAMEPLGDTSILLENRGLGPGDERSATSGPGRVGQALGLDMGWNSVELGFESGLAVLDDGVAPPVETTGRIGVSSGGHLNLRYILAGSRYLSRPPRCGAPVAR